MENICVRLEEKQLEEVKKLQKLLEASDNSTAFRLILTKGIHEIKIQKALESYSNGDVSLGLACEISGLSYWEFLDEMSRRSVYVHYSKEDLEDDVRR